MLKYDLQFFADNGDKTEEPTGKKLSDARKEGQVAKSREIVNCLMLFIFFLIALGSTSSTMLYGGGLVIKVVV